MAKPSRHVHRDRTRRRTSIGQEELLLWPEAHEKVYAETFRRLYYHLYSNSRSSRAERIISDLANLLLCKVSSELDGSSELVERFVNGSGSANKLLLPALIRQFPELKTLLEPFSIEDDAVRYGLRELARLSFRSASGHILGEAFQALIGPRLRGDRGQFFTPRSLVRAMIAVLNPPPGAKVVDPACGTAGFLVETHARQQAGRQRRGALVGIEKDRDLARLSAALLRIVAPGRSHIHNASSLDLASLARLPSEASPLEADYVLTNPPFGSRIKISDASILRQFALGHHWQRTVQGWVQVKSLRDAQDPQILFLELCIRLLRPGGRLGIVLPEGVFGNSSLGYVWDFLRSQGRITELLDCPRTTFQPSTDTKTNVLFFQRGEKREPDVVMDSAVWTAVALHAGHDRRGRTVNSAGEPFADDYQVIGVTAAERGEGSPWQRVVITDPYYLVPRYYDKSAVKALEEETTRLNATLVSLGDLVGKGHLFVRKGHEVGAELYGSGDIPFIRTSDLANYEVFADPTRGVSEEVYSRYSAEQRLRAGDVLFVADGRYRIGRTAILHQHNCRCLVQSHIRILQIGSGAPIDAVELLYLLNLSAVQRQIRNLVFIQSTLGTLGRRFYDIQIPIPTRDEGWKARIEEFRGLIENRAAMLARLQRFEQPGYDL